MLHTLLILVHFFCAVGIVALVLFQRGKGAEAGAGFGAGASGTVFGARGASTALSRATAILAGVFMLTSLSLAYLGTRQSAASSSLIDRLPPASSSGAPAAPAAAPAVPAAPATSPTPQPPATSSPAPQAPATGGSAPK